ncbi:serine/threonine protein kinase [Halogeometricum borinquense]|uniref:Serine/threonine protein kinase n=1 Tax=Halogeometricum borinquense TaxID=60847 RepID=A0A482TQP3_9EURY|nr:serine/threonine protein kinase [Halogeometricum borinquense]RYJ14269.1 serine/threonine protein kinase [Halogeometricum borinquense]
MMRTDSRGRFRYRAFGLDVASTLTFPELPETVVTESAEGDADVFVRVGTVPFDGETPDDGPAVTFETPEEFILLYDACRITVSQGREIVVDPAPDATERDVRWTVLGPAFNFLLHQRGHLVLHGSVVAVDGRAVAFVGESGAGKSTTAGAFAAAGHRALGDDVAAIRFTDDGPVVQPGFASIKLHDDAAATLGGGLVPVTDGGENTPTASRPDERFYRTADVDSDPVPLAAVYRLVDGDDVTVTPLPSVAAVAELGRNAYTVGTQQRRDEAILAVDRCLSVVESVPVATLTRPRRFDALPDVVSRIEQEVGS